MNSDNNGVIKDDINFLEYPNWIVMESKNSQNFTIQKEKGLYTIKSSLNLPNRFDKIILYYLLSELFKNTNFESSQIKTTRYKIAKNVFYETKNVGKSEYDRVINSIKKWTAIFIQFEGMFYEGDNYTTRGFHIIDGYKLDDKGILQINFNEQYLEQLKNTNYFKLIDFNEYKKLTRPISNRLYEILIKTFKNREIWQIRIAKLAEKLTVCDKFPSHIYRAIIPAVNEINNKTELKLKLEYNQETQICTFMKLQNTQEEKQKEPNSLTIPEEDKFKALTSILPKEHQDKKTILESITNFYKKYGFDYTARNIKYTNQHCNGNYRAYLNKALKEDWGLTIQEEEESKQKIIKEQEYKKQQEQEALRQQIELQRQVQEYIKTLSPKKLETLRKEAISQLDEETKRAGKLFGNLEMLIQFQIEKIVLKKLKAETS
jgi:hypothetical protein